MVKAPGRDQRAAMERLVRLASVLHHAGERGVPATNLLDVAGWSDAEDGVSALGRDFRHLARLGWQIDNIAGRGFEAIYRMRTVDNRLRVRLTPAQQAALRRAVLLADRDDLADRLGLAADERLAPVAAVVQARPSPTLSTVTAALRQQALLRFRYHGRDRVVHPLWVSARRTEWYLHAREDGITKEFVVARIGDARCDRPGTATPSDQPGSHGGHPITWPMDPPVDVRLETTAEYLPDVRRWLGEPASVVEEPERVVVTYRVTHRAALRARVYQLGTRVRVLGPTDVRAEMLAELASMAGEQ